ncbi:MAG: hypothetical protein WC859_01860 [Elusimicrobiota bacterium]|jgi:hypothetical protein
MNSSESLPLQTRLKWISLAGLLAAMLGIFAYALPHLSVDRVSEHIYLGVPYRMFADRDIHIYQGDPFVENGPHVILATTAFAFHGRSLKPMRYYNFVYSLAVVGLFFWFFFKLFDETWMRPWEIPVIALLVLSVWITIPLILIYPIQVNGMTPGLLCFIAGLLLEKHHPRWAMIAFGFAYSCKGQFLAMLPGLFLYKLLFENRGDSIALKIRELVLCAVLYFVPATVFLTAIGWAFGLFHNREDLLAYAFRAPSILFSEFSYIIPVLMRKTASDPFAAQGRAIEYARWGFVTWLLIALSIGFCVVYAARSFFNRKESSSGPLQVPATMLAVAGIGYWINYFFFWRYPFWYNTLPMEWFNILIIPAAIYGLKIRLSHRWTPRFAAIFLVLVALLAGRNILRRVIIKPVFDSTSQGDSLQPYPWMK